MEGNQYMQKNIPITSRIRYITDKPALNIPAPEDTTGDWHFDNMFFNVSGDGKPLELLLAGDGEALNTNHIFGSYGIHECSSAVALRAGARDENVAMECGPFSAAVALRACARDEKPPFLQRNVMEA